MRFFGLIHAVLSLALLSMTTGAARADDDNSVIFDPPGSETERTSEEPDAPMSALGFKKIPADEALSSIRLDLLAGGWAADSGENLFLAFALDVRYLRECYGSRKSALCTFFRSGLSLAASARWRDPADPTSRYGIVLVPIEYVTGRFAKSGPDLATTDGALYAAAGARVEAVRDLGLEIERRILGVLNAELNFASPTLLLTPGAGFRWIGSMRVFGGGASTAVPDGGSGAGVVAGLESLVGMALDLDRGTILVTNSTRLEGGIGFGGGSGGNGFGDCAEIRYLRSVCRAGSRNKACGAPHRFEYGMGLRYEVNSFTASANDHTTRRILLFAEVGRF